MRQVFARQALSFANFTFSGRWVLIANHDIPLHNVLSRFVRPLEKYRRYITDDLEPCFIDDEIAVLGINTARSVTIKSGRINAAQMERVRERLCALG